MACVLVVEDDPAIQHAYQFVLEKAGHEVLLASDGSEAVKLLERLPQVVFLDMLMPGFSGLDFLREADVLNRFPGMKVVAVTNIESPRVREDAMGLGAVQYLVKVNLNPSDLVRIVAEYVGGAS